MAYEGAKASFNTAAEQYDAARPGYPEALIDHVIQKAGLTQESRLLEIGAGTGKASVLFAQRGYQMLCLEPGVQMGEIARRNLAPFPRSEVETTTFEEWPLRQEAFDLVISAQAFHWVDPEIGLPKVAEALKPAGWFALFWNLPSDDDNEMWTEIQKAYVAHANELSKRLDVKSLTEDVEEIEQDLDAHAGLFINRSIERFAWATSYTADEYINLLGTYSDHIGLEPSRRNRLFEAIRDVIAHHGGIVEKRYTCVLAMAQRLVGS